MARPHPIDALILPLTWVARARGRRRLLLLTGYAVILGTVGALVGREAILWKLPDAPEPFDLARYDHVELADADNAMIPYRRAVAAIAPGTPRNGGLQGVLTPAMIEPNRAALDLWLRGTGRPDALLDQPGEPPAAGRWALLNDLATLGQLALLDATRRQTAGDLAGAWTLDGAVIRTGLHVGRHARSDSGGYGVRAIREAALHATAWADDPRTTADLLRRALADLAACRALESSAIDTARVDYLGARADLLDPEVRRGWQPSRLRNQDWENHLPGVTWAHNFLWNEPKRSLKVLRLVAAGQFAQADRPIADRSPMFDPDYLIFQVDASTPPLLARIKPADLAAWVRASYALVPLSHIAAFQGQARATRQTLDLLRLHLAQRAYTLEHAGSAPSRFGDLLGPYLDALPEGFAPSDSLVAP